jgi:hypothetical protein
MSILVLLSIVLVFLILVPHNFSLSKVFLVLKVLTTISLLFPILVFVWFVMDPSQIEDAASLPDFLVLLFSISAAGIGGLAFAWLAGYVYWLYAKKNDLLEISSFYVAVMLIAAIAGWATIPMLILRTWFGDRY